MSILTSFAGAGTDFAAVTGGAGKSLATFLGIDPTALTNAISALAQPMLCFIPIKSETLTMRHINEIGNTMLISQTTQQKDYVTDNVAPRPRTWSGKGYIDSLAPLAELGLMIKPTLLIQQAILEAAADSRQPVKFKTDTGEVFDVVVQDLQITSIDKGNGVKMIAYTVQEVKVLENATYSGESAETLGKAGAASIPKRAITNLGKGKALGAGLMNGAAAFLRLPALPV
jgi:hypothetical protein